MKHGHHGVGVRNRIAVLVGSGGVLLLHAVVYVRTLDMAQRRAEARRFMPDHHSRADGYQNDHYDTRDGKLLAALLLRRAFACRRFDAFSTVF